MARNNVSSYFGQFSLPSISTETFASAFFSNSTISLSNISTQRKKIWLRRAYCAVFKKAKSSVKCKCLKAISKLQFSDRADQATSNGSPYPFYTPDFQASLSYISSQSSDTAVNQQHAGIQSNEQVSEPVSARPKDVRFYDKVCKNALYCAHLDDLLTESLETKSICAITLDNGKFWRSDDAYKRRIEVVERLSNIARPVCTNCKALHLAIQYFDQFLCDFDLPSMIDFLLLAFRRAAVELPEWFAKQQRLEWPHNEQLPAVTTLIASGPCLNVCHDANTHLRSHISPLFRNSELAAACFFNATQSEDIDSTVFIKCTGHSIESLQSAIAYARAVCGAI